MTGSGSEETKNENASLEDTTDSSEDRDSAEKDGDWINEADLDELLEYDVEKEALQVVRRESREVLSERIHLLKDLDDKAMRTVRMSVLFIGLVISAIQVSDGSFSEVETTSTSFQLGVGGVTFLLLSIILGVWTYSASEPDFGISDDHRTDVVDGEFTEKEWLLFQLGEYNEWIGNMRSLTEKNVLGLHLTLFTATAGVLALLLSVVQSIGWKIDRLIFPAVVTIGLSAIVGLLLYVVSKYN